MSRFFGKKKGAATEDDEVNRSNLFGNRAAQNPPSNSHNSHVAGNPYASQRGGSDPGYGGAPPADYGSRSDSGYGGSSYAAQNPYAPRRGGDGDRYGSSIEPNREKLFGARKQGYGRDDSYSHQHYPNEPSAGNDSEDEDRETEELKKIIGEEKRRTRDSARNALAAAERAEEIGRATLGRLGVQGEHLHNTEKNLDLASNQNRVAEEKARELKHYNRSLFVPSVNFPRSSARAREEEAKILARHQGDREEREKTREFGYDSKNRVGRALNDATGRVESRATTSLAERSKFQFEADSSDDEKETEIAHNLDQLGAITGRLKGLAMATSVEVDRQNVQIEKIMKKSDRVDDQIAVNHDRIRRIH